MALDILPAKASITTEYYTKVVLQKVVNAISEQRLAVKISKTLMLQDNAVSHNAKITATFLGERRPKYWPASPTI